MITLKRVEEILIVHHLVCICFLAILQMIRT